MPDLNPSHPEQNNPEPLASDPVRAPLNSNCFEVLLVDVQPEWANAMQQAMQRAVSPDQVGAGQQLHVRTCSTLAEARQMIEASHIDLAVVHQELADGQGADLARDLNGARRLTKTIVVSDHPSVDAAVQAIRAGASDFVDQSQGLSACLAELESQVIRLVGKHKHDQKKATREKRLRKLCRELHEARQEVSEQVEMLCSDLVTAYQELAQQVAGTMGQDVYGQMIQDELDFEQLLRRTLEHVVQKSGSSNAAIFLPAALDEYTLGGYVNYDCGQDGAELLLQHLADIVAPRMAEQEGLVALTDNQSMRHWFDDDAEWLMDHHLLGMSCKKDNEVLAVLVLFRDASVPYTDEAVATMETVAPKLAQALAKVIRVHHRASPDSTIDGDWESEYGDDAMPF